MEQLVQLVCDYKHSYTQHGGLRPFGVAFLFAGWDRCVERGPHYPSVHCSRSITFTPHRRAMSDFRAPLHLPRHFGFQLYQSDPAGNYSGWKATAIGSNSQSAQSNLKSDYR